MLGGRRLGYFAGVLAALYLPFAWSATVVLSECLGAFLAALQLLLALEMTARSTKRTWWLFAAFGVASAALALVKPAFVLWTIAPIVYLFARRFEPPRRLLLLTGVALAGFGLLMVPWWTRNAVTLHQFIPLSTGAGNPMLVSSGGVELSPQERAVAAIAKGRGRDPEVSAAVFRMSRQFSADPAQFVVVRARVAGIAASKPWIAPLDVMWEENFHPDVARVDFGMPFPKQPTAALESSWSLAHYYQWFLLATAVASVAFFRRSPRLILVATLPLYVIAVHYLNLFLDRYFFPAMPSVIVLAAAAAYGLWQSGRSRSRRARS